MADPDPDTGGRPPAQPTPPRPPVSRVEAHETALRDFAATARAVPAERWNVPVSPGKWSPEQITLHVALAYEGLLRELRGQGSMEVRRTAWRRFLLRKLVLPRVLRGDIPEGAPAPRETRPDQNVELSERGNREGALERLESAASAFVEALLEARRHRPRMRLTHPYFGGMPLDDTLLFATVHTRHHLAQVEQAVDRSGKKEGSATSPPTEGGPGQTEATGQGPG